MPAPELETLVADLVGRHLSVPSIKASIVGSASTEETADITQRITALIAGESHAEDQPGISALLRLIEKVQIAPGKIQISIATKAIAECLTVEPARISEDHLSFV
ncbi:hypothetical protein [Roseovarius azorensis]|uniref:hypothetical protein n=1 Tax=Roseovarius azorensis TaxID=1287727 RepID=UPI001587EEDC|nr:hypothetical protein [Roseovarius azorensis]